MVQKEAAQTMRMLLLTSVCFMDPNLIRSDSRGLEEEAMSKIGSVTSAKLYRAVPCDASSKII